MEVVKNEILFFEPKMVQYSIVGSQEVLFRPISTLENSSVIQFQDLGNSEYYRNLSSAYISLKVKMNILGDDSKPLTNPITEDNVPVACVNNLLHSMFRQVTLTLNGKQVSQNNMNYSYR